MVFVSLVARAERREVPYTDQLTLQRSGVIECHGNDTSEPEPRGALGRSGRVRFAISSRGRRAS